MRFSVGAATLGAAVTGALAVRYSGEATAGPVDRAVADALHDALGTAPRLDLLADLGNPPVVVVAAAVLAAVALRRGERWLAATAVVAPAVTGLATTLVKVATDRTYDDHLAYPSGHAGVVTALVLVAALLAPPRWRVLAPVVVVGVAVALVVRDYHYATDTVGGVALATTVVALSAAGRAAWPGRAPSPLRAAAPAAHGPR
ncbi:MAG: phosphatase PAP2 family protein [Pseudonocardiaceae bacterium]